jgi:uncharacterized membrane protein
MMVLVVLAGTYVVARLLPSRHGRRPPPDAARAAMTTAMAFTGVSHLARPEPFVQQLPRFVPARERVIFWTGLLEMLLGAALSASTRRRREVALALAAYLIAVFPANVYVAVADVKIEGLPGAAHPWLRLPFQAVYIAWTFWAAPGSWVLARDLAQRLATATAGRRGGVVSRGGRPGARVSELVTRRTPGHRTLSA